MKKRLQTRLSGGQGPDSRETTFKIDSCQTIGSFKEKAKSILLQDSDQVEWLIDKAIQKFARPNPPGFEGLIKSLQSIKGRVGHFSREDLNRIIIRALRKANQTTKLPDYLL